MTSKKRPAKETPAKKVPAKKKKSIKVPAKKKPVVERNGHGGGRGKK